MGIGKSLPVLPDASPPWRALIVRSGGEADAAGRLSTLGVPVVAPTRVVRRRRSRWCRARVEVREPVVRGYVFGALADGMWGAALDAPSVLGVVTVDGWPGVVRPAEIETLRRLDDAGGGPLFGAGALVEICGTHTPLDGWVVRVVDVAGERARVAMSLLGPERAVNISVDCLTTA